MRLNEAICRFVLAEYFGLAGSAAAGPRCRLPVATVGPGARRDRELARHHGGLGRSRRAVTPGSAVTFAVTCANPDSGSATLFGQTLGLPEQIPMDERRRRRRLRRHRDPA